MESILILGATGFLTTALVQMATRSAGLLWKWGGRAACGFFCLWLLNLASPVTGIAFPMNAVTVALAGTLGLPGIGLLTFLAVMSV